MMCLICKKPLFPRSDIMIRTDYGFICPECLPNLPEFQEHALRHLKTCPECRNAADTVLRHLKDASPECRDAMAFFLGRLLGQLQRDQL